MNKVKDEGAAKPLLKSTTLVQPRIGNHEFLPDKLAMSNSDAAGDEARRTQHYQELSDQFRQYREATDRTLASMQTTIAALEGRTEGQERTSAMRTITTEVDATQPEQPGRQRQTTTRQPIVQQRHFVAQGPATPPRKPRFCANASCAHRPNPHLLH